MPTETGLSLFGVLNQADPALVDPGVTAQLECLLDEVVIGKQEMVGAIDAVCDVAQRIIGKLKEDASVGGPPLLGAAVNCDAGGRPPTQAMKRFANSVARQKGIKPPPGYTKSGSICRAFLDQHAPKKADVETSLYGSPEIFGHWCAVGFRAHGMPLWSGRSWNPGDCAERADQSVVGRELVPGDLASIHDVRQAGKQRIGEPMAA